MGTSVMSGKGAALDVKTFFLFKLCNVGGEDLVVHHRC